MRPVFCVDNIFSAGVGKQYPSHVVSAEEEGTDAEAFRVADGRRDPDDKWTSTTLNSATYIDVACDQVRAVDFFALDRGHNLGGYGIQVWGSMESDFATYETVLSITLPTYSAPGNIDDALGVRTEEGAWIKRTAARAYQYWRWYVPAMGAGLKPEIVLAWMGLSYSPEGLDMPWHDDRAVFVMEESQGERGWVGRGGANKVRAGAMNLTLSSFGEYDAAVRYHLQGLYADGYPMWCVMDEDQAERAFLATLPGGSEIGFGYSRETGYRTAQIPYREHEAYAP